MSVLRPSRPVEARPCRVKRWRTIGTALTISALSVGIAPANAVPVASPSATASVSAADAAASKAKADQLSAAAASQAKQLADAKTAIADLQRQLDDAHTAADVAKENAKHAAAEAKAAKTKAEKAAKAAAVHRDDLGRWAASAYISGDSAQATEFMDLLESRNTDDLAQHLQMQRMVGRWRGNTVVTMNKAEAEQKHAETEAVNAQSQADVAAEDAAAAEREADKLVTQQQAEIDKLAGLLASTTSDAKDAATKAGQDAAALAAQQAAAEAARIRGSASAAASPEDIARQQAEVDALPAGSAREKIAATAQYLSGQNIPYVWGGTTPAGFDCSGFSSYVYRQAGISLPRTAAAQQGYVQKVTDPQVGDLVFYGSPAYHVGIYAGGGQMWHAPHSGTTVKLARVYGNPSNYGRIAGL